MYDYQTERPKLFTEDGIKKLLVVYAAILKRADAPKPISAGAIFTKVCGDSWETLACLDFLKEAHAVTEVHTGSDTPAQGRLFIA